MTGVAKSSANVVRTSTDDASVLRADGLVEIRHERIRRKGENATTAWASLDDAAHNPKEKVDVRAEGAITAHTTEQKLREKLERRWQGHGMNDFENPAACEAGEGLTKIKSHKERHGCGNVLLHRIETTVRV